MTTYLIACRAMMASLSRIGRIDPVENFRYTIHYGKVPMVDTGTGKQG